MYSVGCLTDEFVIDGPALKYRPSDVAREVFSSPEFISMNSKMQVPFSASHSSFSDKSVFIISQDFRLPHLIFTGGLAKKLGTIHGYDPLLSELGGLTHDIGHGWASHATDGMLDHHEVGKRLLTGEDPTPAASQFLEGLGMGKETGRLMIPSILEKHGVDGGEVADAFELPSVDLADDLAYSLRDSEVCGVNISNRETDLKNFKSWVGGLEREGDLLFFKKEKTALSFSREYSKRTLFYYNSEGARGRVALLRKYVGALAEAFSTSGKAVAETTCMLTPRWFFGGVESWCWLFHRAVETYGKGRRIKKKMGAPEKEIAQMLFYDYSRLAYRRPLDGELSELKKSKREREKLEKRLNKKGKRMFVVDTAPIAKARKMSGLVKGYGGKERPYQKYHDMIDDFRIYVYGGETDTLKARRLCEKVLGEKSVPLELTLKEVENLPLSAE